MLNINNTIEIRYQNKPTETGTVREFLEWILNDMTKLNSVAEWCSYYALDSDQVLGMKRFEHKGLESLFDGHIIKVDA